MLIDYLKQLIKFKTISENHKENRKAFSWIKKITKPYGLYVAEEESMGFPSLILTTRPTNKPMLWLSAHMDVVSAPDELFLPKIKNGKIYGRGAYDMKFAIACYLKLLSDFRQNISQYNFGIMLTSDEEVDGENGVKYLLQKGYKSKICFMPDGGYDWNMEKGAKGIWDFTVTAKGKSAHPSTPWRGKNAIEELIAFLQEIKKCFKKLTKKSHNGLEMNLDTITSGDEDCRVPDFAQAFVDIFITNKKEYENVYKIVMGLKKKYLGITIKNVSLTNSYKNNLENIYIKKYAETLGSFGIKTKPSLSHSTSDARFFAYKKIPVIAIRPQGGGHHGLNEWINIKYLKIYYEVLKKYIAKITSVSRYSISPRPRPANYEAARKVRLHP